jgi:hypothetical protein
MPVAVDPLSSDVIRPVKEIVCETLTEIPARRHPEKLALPGGIHTIPPLVRVVIILTDKQVSGIPPSEVRMLKAALLEFIVVVVVLILTCPLA